MPEDQLRAYTAALADRFSNPAIKHLLAQVAADGSQKIPVRIVPALKATLDAGPVEAADGALRAVAAWVVHARGAGAPLTDADEAQVRELVSGSLSEALTRVLGRWGLTDPAVTQRAEELAADLQP